MNHYRWSLILLTVGLMLWINGVKFNQMLIYLPGIAMVCYSQAILWIHIDSKKEK